jgi:hypothetical protein
VRCCLVWLVVLACLFPAGRTKAGEQTSLDFVYVNANIGEAAGGHTALRLGTTVFHFQFFPEGRFLLVRDSWPHFCYVYNELHNRSIFIGRLPLSLQVDTSIKSHFTRLLMAQQQDLDRLHTAEDECVQLSCLVDGTERLNLDYVGLFARKGTDDADMVTLRQHISSQLGALQMTEPQAQVGRRLARLETDRFAELSDLLLEREFFRLLATGASLDSTVILPSSPDFPGLSPAEERVLQRYRERLRYSIIQLLRSSRPDRARSLLLQTARYLVVSRSLTTHTLLTLDPFSSRAVAVPPPADSDLQGLYLQLGREEQRARQGFFQETAYPDIAYALLETVQGRRHELANAIQSKHPIRVEGGILLPSRRGTVPLPHLSLTRGELQRMLAAKRAELKELRGRFDSRYSYDLLKRNCATELLRSLNSSFPDRETGRRELGGWLDPDKDLNFIPNRLYADVLKEFPVTEEVLLPARRLRQLEGLYAENDSLSVRLRESNTLSSTLYTARAEDTPFLFFTDNAFWFRPVLGITNFCWAALSGFSGILTLPMDNGTRIHQGLRGMFYSLPELAFNNIRKGSYGFAATAELGP